MGAFELFDWLLIWARKMKTETNRIEREARDTRRVHNMMCLSLAGARQRDSCVQREIVVQIKPFRHFTMRRLGVGWK